MSVPKRAPARKPKRAKPARPSRAATRPKHPAWWLERMAARVPGSLMADDEHAKRLLRDLLLLETWGSGDETTSRTRAAGREQVRAIAADAKRWTDIANHLEAAARLASESDGDRWLPGIMWATSGELYPPEVREFAAARGFEMPGRRINVLDLSASWYLEWCVKQAAKRAADRERELPQSKATAATSPKAAADRTRARLVMLCERLGAEGWTRAQIADLIATRGRSGARESASGLVDVPIAASRRYQPADLQGSDPTEARYRQSAMIKALEKQVGRARLPSNRRRNPPKTRQT